MDWIAYTASYKQLIQEDLKVCTDVQAENTGGGKESNFQVILEEVNCFYCHFMIEEVKLYQQNEFEYTLSQTWIQKIDYIQDLNIIYEFQTEIQFKL